MEKICPICGTGELKKEVTTETFEYKKRKITIPNYIAYKCNACKESIVDKKTLKSSGKILKERKREIDNLLSVKEVKKIRESLGFTQEQMSEVLGGGLKGFARYELGYVTQSKAMDNLLRIIDKYPSVINVIWNRTQAKGKKIVNVIHLDEYRDKRYKGKIDSYTVDVKGTKGNYHEASSV